MRTNIADTSLDAFCDLKQANTLQQQQKQIIKVMLPDRTYTRRELALLSNLETSTVSARVNSMIDVCVQVVGRKKDPFTGKNVEALMLKAAA